MQLYPFVEVSALGSYIPDIPPYCGSGRAVKDNREVKVHNKDRKKTIQGISLYCVNLGFKQPGCRFSAIFRIRVPGSDRILEVQKNIFFVIEEPVGHCPARVAVDVTDNEILADGKERRGGLRDFPVL